MMFSKSYAEYRHEIREIVDLIYSQATCLEKYAEQDGHSGKAPASVYHWQATHFRDLADRLAKVVP